ncbi:hypothetical protein CRUP_017449 [Coryphaenoides rupestris]|nr:hypothetical protein CRUP_017449 [Coryphaenoides rupestris]
MFQGLTIKPLVKWLKVPRSTNRKPTINEEIHERAFDHILTAVEDIAGLQGYHHWRDKWEQFDKKYLSRLLLRRSVYHKGELWEAYQKINMRDAISVVDQYQSHYSRHYMAAGEQERQEREVYQRNMRSRMENKTSRHKRHKKDRSQKKHRGSDAKEPEGNEKPRRNVSWQDKDPVVVPVESDEDREEEEEPSEREEDVGITFVARKEEAARCSSSGPAALETSGSPSLASPTCGERFLPWKAGAGSLPPCVSVEATKIIPVDLQQAWNQSISSLESISSPLNPNPNPTVTALSPSSRNPDPRVTALSPSSRNPDPRVTALSRLSGQPPSSSSLLEKEQKEEDEEALSAQQEEVQPLMSVRPLASPLSSTPGGRRRNPCVYLRSLVTAPPAGSTETHTRGPTQL